MEYSPASSPFCKQPVTVVLPPADFSCANALGVTYAPSANTNTSNADKRTSFFMFNLLIDEWAQSQIPGFHRRVAAWTATFQRWSSLPRPPVGTCPSFQILGP